MTRILRDGNMAAVLLSTDWQVRSLMSATRMAVISVTPTTGTRSVRNAIATFVLGASTRTGSFASSVRSFLNRRHRSVPARRGPMCLSGKLRTLCSMKVQMCRVPSIQMIAMTTCQSRKQISCAARTKACRQLQVSVRVAHVCPQVSSLSLSMQSVLILAVSGFRKP